MRRLCLAIALIAAASPLAAQQNFSTRDQPEIRTRQLNNLNTRVKALEAGGGGSSGVSSVNTRTGAVTIVSGDVTTALGYTPATPLGYTPLNPANNLSDLVSTSTARTNLGLGTAATQASTAFATASHTHAFTDVVSIPTGSLIYRKTAGTGAAETQTLATLKTDLGLTGSNTGDQTITLTGAVTGSGSSSFSTTLASGIVGLSNMANVATGTLFYRKTAATGAPEVQPLATLKSDLGLTGTNSGDQTITLTGPVTGSGSGSFATSVTANAITRAMLSATSGAAILGATAAGNVADLTGTQATTLLDPFTSALKGLAPASGGGTTNFLRADGTWAAPPSGSGSGTVTSVSVTTANGVSGTVATATTTPAISLTLGAITPTSVAASGTVTGSNLAGTHSGASSGTNTGDQTITLTGDVTGSGTGSFATTLATSGVTAASYTNANITIDAKGRVTAAANGTAGSGVSRLFSAFTNVSLIANTTEQTLQTFTMASGQLATNGQVIHLRAGGTMVAAAKSRIVKLYFGATVVATFVSSVATSTAWFLEADIVRQSATVQLAYGPGFTNTPATSLTKASPAETLSGAVTVKLTGTTSATAAVADITCDYFLVEFLP